MNYLEFGNGYRDFSPRVNNNYVAPSIHVNPELDDLFEESRNWSDHFGKLVMRHLFSAPFDAPVEIAILNEYIDWTLDEVPSLYRAARDATLADPDNIDYLSELNFHLVAPRVENQWHMLLDQAYTAPDQRTDESQSWIATIAADIARARKSQMALEEKSGIRNGIVGAYNGQLTELDAHIAALEVSRQNPNRGLIFLPAPKRFESFRSVKNADLLMLDRLAQQARGIQVKTRLSDNDLSKAVFERYNPDFITFIDGFTDLGNCIDQEIGGGRHRSVSWPGLVSMDHLMRTPIHKMPGAAGQNVNKAQSRGLRMTQLRTKQIAAELSRGRKNFIPIAVQNISGRLLQDLQKEPTYEFYKRDRPTSQH